MVNRRRSGPGCNWRWCWCGWSPARYREALVVTLAEHGLGCADFDVRALALRLFLQPPLNQDAELLARVVPFLKDAAAEVRRVALLAVGSNPDLVAEDDLLPLLHDADAEVCQFCEVALRAGGFRIGTLSWPD